MKMFLLAVLVTASLFTTHSFAADDPFAKANEKMHKDMMVAPTGNVDVDFVRGMIPHHQGAVDMAEILLKQGNDPALKTLAREIIAAQQEEIDFMKSWLEKHAPEAALAPAEPVHDGHAHH